MLNHFNFQEFHGAYLLTNDLGRYAFVSKAQLRDLISGSLDPDSPVGQKLQEQFFLFQGSVPGLLQRETHFMRDSKNYLFEPTTLHIFVVTNECNANCVYCQANNGFTKLSDRMDPAVGERAVDITLSSPAPALSFEFQGGEPLLNFDVIRHIIEYAEKKNTGKEIYYSLVSNLTLLTDDMLEFFQKHRVNISTSLDGPQFLHDHNRPYKSGAGTYQDLRRAVNRVRKAGLKLGAIETTTRFSLPHAKEIVDIYAEWGFHSLFLRPLTPLGCAQKQWNEIGYTPEEFTAFYQEAIHYILEKNLQGYRMQEGHAATFFSKILHGYPVNYMELRSPCGASLGQMAYYTNGDVFTCDEGRMLYEMGNDAFRLGNVWENTYSQLVHSSTCRAVCLASITESIPGCCDCVYQPYCGVCPVVNVALYGDLLPKSPQNYRCGLYRGMLNVLFSLLQQEEPMTMKLLESWYA